MNEMKIKWVDIDSVIPYENNPRRNEDAVEPVANSIKEFGWQQPIVVDKDNVIIVGHTRLKAGKHLGLDKVPVLVADELNDDQVKAYRLADNKVGELAMWDFTLLDTELDEIELDMDGFGFSVDLDDDFIGDLMNDDYVDHIETNTFSITFDFKKEHEEKVKSYIAEYGKTDLVELMLKEVEECLK